jgi:hypothetical protein
MGAGNLMGPRICVDSLIVGVAGTDEDDLYPLIGCTATLYLSCVKKNWLSSYSTVLILASVYIMWEPRWHHMIMKVVPSYSRSQSIRNDPATL